MTECEYCTGDSDGFKNMLDNSAIICAHGNNPVIKIKANGRQWIFPIRFCPMCGRRLKDDVGSKTD